MHVYIFIHFYVYMCIYMYTCKHAYMYTSLSQDEHIILAQVFGQTKTFAVFAILADESPCPPPAQ